MSRQTTRRKSAKRKTSASPHPRARATRSTPRQSAKSTAGSVSHTEIIVIGAGLAGLCSAHELSRAGHEVLVLEARKGPGGRIRTLTEPFSDNLYAEAGAFFVSSKHTLTMKYIADFELELDELLPGDKSFLFYFDQIQEKEQKFIKVPPFHPLGLGLIAKQDRQLAESPWPREFKLKETEWKDGLLQFLSKYCGIGKLGNCADPAWPLRELKKYDVSFLRFLKDPDIAGGASDSAISLMRPWFEPWWDDLDKISALHLHRDAAIGLSIGARDRTWHTIRGGMQRLPDEFANRFSGTVRYRAPVERIEQDGKSVGITYRDLDSKTSKEVKGDHVICTIPFSVLRGIKGIEGFHPEKQKAIKELPYASIARVYLQCTDRNIWTGKDWKGALYTDLPIMNLIDSTFHQKGTARGILHAFMSGSQADSIKREKSDKKRVDAILGDVMRIYPGLEVEREHCTSKCWDEDEWAKGAYAYFKPGQMYQLMPHIVSPEGRIHFAGDHTSPLPGWMQGALESGIRAAKEIDPQVPIQA